MVFFYNNESFWHSWCEQKWLVASCCFFELYEKVDRYNNWNHTVSDSEIDIYLQQIYTRAGILTDTGRKGFVPHASVPAETGQCAAAMEAVSGVAGVQDKSVGIMAVILDFIAIVGDPGFLAANQVKTYERAKQSERQTVTKKQTHLDEGFVSV